MALLDSAYKQRMVGALVLVALAVIFLPMLFSRQDEQRQVTVEAPAAPQAPVIPQVQVEPVVVPEPQALPQEPVPSDDEIAIGDTGTNANWSVAKGSTTVSSGAPIDPSGASTSAPASIRASATSASSLLAAQ